MNPAASKQNGRREYTKHGLTTLKKTVKQLGNRVIDKRTTTGRELAKWRNDLIEDLGGLDNVSAQQRTLVDIIVITKLLHDSATAWILSQPLINARKRTLLAVDALMWITSYATFFIGPACRCSTCSPPANGAPTQECISPGTRRITAPTRHSRTCRPKRGQTPACRA